MSSDAEREALRRWRASGLASQDQQWVNRERRASFIAGAEWERSRPVSGAEKESATNAVHRALAARWMSVSDALGGDQAYYEALLQDMARNVLEAAAKVRAQGGNHE